VIDLVIAAALAQAQARTPHWRLFSDRPGQAGTMSYDPASVRRRGTGIDVNVRFLYPRATGSGERWLVWRTHLDCAARTHMIRSVVGYDDAGRQLFDRPWYTDMQRPFPVTPGTPDAVLLDMVCRR
jgi:hypothetical protein